MQILLIFLLILFFSPIWAECKDKEIVDTVRDYQKLIKNDRIANTILGLCETHPKQARLNLFNLKKQIVFLSQKINLRDYLKAIKNQKLKNSVQNLISSIQDFKKSYKKSLPIAKRYLAIPTLNALQTQINQIGSIEQGVARVLNSDMSGKDKIQKLNFIAIKFEKQIEKFRAMLTKLKRYEKYK